MVTPALLTLSAARKKPRIQSREVEQQGKVLDLEDTIVKTESDVN